MRSKKINILLADDDQGDCLLFKEALKELPVSVKLTIVHNGEEVIEEISKKGKKMPDVLFLDLNMPRKNGFASLGEIKRSNILQDLPVIIFSTTAQMDAVMKVFRDAAHYYICKPTDFAQLKRVLYEALTLIAQKDIPLPLKENFMITGDATIIPESAKS